MHLASDYIHPTPHKGRCRVRIFEPDAEGNPGDHHVVVFSEVPENEGQSITNAIEQLAGEVMLANALPTNATIVIEHYPAAAHVFPAREDETYDLVTFEHAEAEPVLRGGEWRVELGAPEWSHLDREAVATLVGQPLVGNASG